MATRVTSIHDDSDCPVTGHVMSYAADDEHCWVYWTGTQECKLEPCDVLQPYRDSRTVAASQVTPTHCVMDVADGYLFWRDEHGQKFNAELAEKFAAARNDQCRLPTYRVLELKDQ